MVLLKKSLSDLVGKFLPLALTAALLPLALSACADDGAAPALPSTPAAESTPASDQDVQDRADSQGKMADAAEAPDASEGEQDPVSDAGQKDAETAAAPGPEASLVVCLEGETPDPFLYGDSSPASTGLRHALNENLTTSLGYAYQMGGLEKLPSLTDGDAQRVVVTVEEGDRLVDANGRAVVLRRGVSVINAAGERVDYSGQSIEMEQLVVDFRLQPLVWSDGTPLAASDSVFSFNVAADPGILGGKGKTQFTQSYQATGDLSLRWTGLPGYLDPTYFTNVWQPLPGKTLRPYTAVQIAGLDIGDDALLSSGPYVIEDLLDDGSLVLAPNAHYYRGDEGVPRISRITMRLGTVEDFLAGSDCDVIAGGAVGMHNFQDLQAGGALEGWQIVSSPGSVYEQIAFGVVPTIDYAGARPAWFDDVRVRQAIAQCTDRQRMADELTGGSAEILNSLVPDGHPLAPEGLINWRHDPDAANALLDAAGYQDYAGDGRRQDVSSGVPMTLTLGTNGESALRLRITEMVQEDLASCGIPVTRYDLPAGTWFYSGWQGPLFGRQFDLAALAWLGHIQPNCDRFTTSSIPGWEEAGYAGWSGSNITGWSDPAYDAACETAVNALPGSADYDQRIGEAIAIFNEQLPALPLFTDYKVVALRPGVINVAPDPTQPSALWNIAEWEKTE